MGDDLRSRLESHSRAFEGLMALMPANLYYGDGDANSDQWQRKKQTKEQKRQAKKAKLEPGAYKSALDVHRENEEKAKKRKREDDDGAADAEDGPVEQAKTTANGAKKQKIAGGKGVGQKGEEKDDETIRAEKAAKRREKRERRNAKKAKLKEKREAKRSQKSSTEKNSTPKKPERTSSATKPGQEDSNDESESDEGDGPTIETLEDDVEVDGHTDMNKLDFDAEDVPVDGTTSDPKVNGVELDQQSDSSISSPVKGSPLFDATPITHSSASSTSSIPAPPLLEANRPEDKTRDKPSARPEKDASGAAVRSEPAHPTNSNNEQSPKLPPLPTINQDALKERLQARLAALRAARKADGIDGKPARSRQELIEARRVKEEQRKQHKKELRAKAKASSQQQQSGTNDAAAEAARLRGGSDSPLWDALSPATETNFAFNRLHFADGTQYSPLTQEVRDPWAKHKRKGPSDPATALAAAEKKQARLAGLDAGKREEIAAKDAWLNASRRAHGDKVADDTSLLKKALKRREKQKGKSGKEWDERLQGVQKGKEARQRKREENLARRREDKGKGKAKAKGAPSGRFGIKFGSSAGAGGGGRKGGPVKKKRPGFEGTFKSGGVRKT